MVWLVDGSPGMAGGNVTVSHISRCVVHFVVQNNMQATVAFWEFVTKSLSNQALVFALHLHGA